MNNLDYFIYFIVFIKLIYFILSVINILLSKKEKDKQTIKNIKLVEFVKDRVEFIFIFFMAILLIIVFYPLNEKQIHINIHTKLLLFIYGIIILLNADWSGFINSSYIYKKIINLRDTMS